MSVLNGVSTTLTNALSVITDEENVEHMLYRCFYIECFWINVYEKLNTFQVCLDQTDDQT